MITLRGKFHPKLHYIFVTPDGRIFQELAASPSSSGYHTVGIRNTKMRRHTLVCETYHGMAQGLKTIVRHRDGNTGNDRYTNLRWGTHKDNMQDAIKHGTFTRGERNGRVELSLAEAQEIYDRRSSGESGSALSREFNISQQTVCGIYKGSSWPDVKRGKRDRYVGRPDKVVRKANLKKTAKKPTSHKTQRAALYRSASKRK